MKIPFSPPYIDQSVMDEVMDTLQSGWITTGPKVKALEELCAAYLQADAAVGVSSATSGLMVLLKWFGVGPGDEVVVPAYTYCATALAAIHCGATVRMVDVGPDFNMDPQQLAQVINANTKAIIAVDFSGWPCDYQALHEQIKAHKHQFKAANAIQEKWGKPLLISDAAHALGAHYKGKSMAVAADFAVYSFHAVKNVTTAEGGLIAWCDSPEKPENLYSHLRTYSLNGQSKDAFTKNQAGAWKYDVTFAGLKANMTDLGAAIGLAQMKKYADNLLPKRRAVAQFYRDQLGNHPACILPLQDQEEKRGSAHLFPLRINKTEAQRDQLIQAMAEAGVALNVHFRPLPDLSLFQSLGFEAKHYPMAMKLYAQEVSLPIYPQLSEEQLSYLCDKLKETLDRL